MDVIVFRPYELPIALGAMRAMVRQLSLRQERYLEILARLHGSSLRARQLRAAPPQLVAATMRDAHRRTRLVQLAIIFATVDGKVSRDQAKRVTELARELEVDEPGLAVLFKLAGRQVLRTRIAMSRRIIGKFFREAWREQGLAGIWQILGGFLGVFRNRAAAERYAQLAHFPEGSLGRALHQYCERNKFALPGNKGAIPERVLFHDIGHLLSGYSTEAAGEIKQAAFQAGFVRNDGFAFLLFGVIQFHLGIQCTPVAKPEVGLFDVEAVMTALARGASCSVDLSDRWNMWSVAERQLDQVRSSFRVPPLRAASNSLLARHV